MKLPHNLKFLIIFLLLLTALQGVARAQVVSHCSERERIVFSCSTNSKKVISFCASNDNKYLQYRFGTLEKIELTYPTQLSHPKGLINAEVEPMPLNDNGTRNDSISIQFKISTFTYSLDFTSIKNVMNMPKKQDIRENASADLFVMKDDKQVAKLQCAKNTISNVSKSILRDFDILNE